MDKTIKVQHDDAVRVEGAGCFEEVLLSLECAASGDDFVWLTPKQARKVAKALRKAASEMEAKSVLRRVES